MTEESNNKHENEERTLSDSTTDVRDEQGEQLKATTTAAQKNTNTVEQQRVSMFHNEDSASDFVPVAPGKRATRSATVGKADPVRDLCLFLGFVVVMYFVSNSLDFQKGEIQDDGVMVMAPEDVPGKKKKATQSLKDMRKALGAILAQRPSKPIRDDCEFFLATGSVPQTGMSLFAGKNYSVGDEIELPWHLPVPYLEVDTEINNEEVSSLWIVPQAILLHHHPLLANIQPSQPLWTSDPPNEQSSSTKTLFKVRATKPVAAGEELFLSFEEHLHSIVPSWYLDHLPTLEDYQEADSLMREVRETFRELKGSRGRKATKDQSTAVVGQALKMIQRIVERYRPPVAKLLPASLNSLNSYRGPADQVTTLYLALQNRTISQLSRQGLCISDVTIRPEEDGKENIRTVRSEVKRGETVHSIPVLARPTNANTCKSKEDGACSQRDSPSNCWTRPESLVELCPLHVAMDVKEKTGEEEASVKLQWTSWNMATDANSVEMSTIQDKADRLELSLVLELVALHDLKEGDKIIANFERDPSNGQWLLPMDLLPSQWSRMLG